MSNERDAFSTTSFTMREICRWKTHRRGTLTGKGEHVESGIPVMVTVGIFAAQPSQEVSVFKMKMEKSR
jgi:hypothetical protein